MRGASGPVIDGGRNDGSVAGCFRTDCLPGSVNSSLGRTDGCGAGVGRTAGAGGTGRDAEVGAVAAGAPLLTLLPGVADIKSTW